MIHKHFDICPSTQKYLIEMSKGNATEDILISCETQTNGVGQRENAWDCYSNTLCLSFTTKENEVLNLTSLEMGVLICDFFKHEFGTQLKLKWPNDILNTLGDKVGGIIINKQGDHRPIVGIGLNLFANNSERIKEYEIKAGFIFNEAKEVSKEDLSQKIFSFVINNRLTSSQTIEKWNSLCIHLNSKVVIRDGDQNYDGFFSGIGKYGQALIKNEGKSYELYSGTLRVNN